MLYEAYEAQNFTEISGAYLRFMQRKQRRLETLCTTETAGHGSLYEAYEAIGNYDLVSRFMKREKREFCSSRDMLYAANTAIRSSRGCSKVVSAYITLIPFDKRWK